MFTTEDSNIKFLKIVPVSLVQLRIARPVMQSKWKLQFACKEKVLTKVVVSDVCVEVSLII